MNARHLRLAAVALLAIYGLICLVNPSTGRLLDSVDLAIHETGHLVFAPFGEVITALGGTLFQLIVPASFVVYFWRRGDRYAAGFALWWVAQNLWNISVYIADARVQILPLVGGGEHDWTYLLSEAGWLANELTIARLVHAAGVLIYVFALGLSATNASRRPVNEESASSLGLPSAAP